MSVRRYRTEIAGTIRTGIECDSEAELERFLGSKGIVLIQAEIAVPTATPAVMSEEPRVIGRPSFDVLIAKAVAELSDALSACDGISAGARLVLKHLAANHRADEIPRMTTVRSFLADRRPVVEKAARNSAKKSKRAKIPRAQGA